MLVKLIKHNITTLGPGKRTVVWLMGCTHACRNCISDNLWPFDKDYAMEEQEIIKKIKEDDSKLITFTGGEPFQQKGLTCLLKQLKKEGFKDILVYTGYTYEEIKDNSVMSKALNYIDVLIDGKYVEELNDNNPLRGSSNQRIIILNEDLKEDYKKELLKQRNYEIEYLDNKLNIYGLVPKGFKEMFSKLKDKINL